MIAIINICVIYRLDYCIVIYIYISYICNNTYRIDIYIYYITYIIIDCRYTSSISLWVWDGCDHHSGKKNAFFSYLGMAFFFKASLMFQVENCDPAATPVLARPKDSSAFENTLATCVLKLMPMAVQSHLWEKSQMNKQRKKQTQIGEMINHNTTMTK